MLIESWKENESSDQKQSADCPYCNNALGEKPKTKRKCPFCKNVICIRTLPETKEKVLMTEDGAKTFDEEKKRKSFEKKWLRVLENYGITDHDVRRQTEKLSEKWGQPANTVDVIWSLFNQHLIPNETDFQQLKMIYHSMALFLSERNEDFFPLLQESIKMELLAAKQNAWAKKVEICADSCCKTCKKLHGKIFTIDEALQEMPIPVKECLSIMNKGNKQGFCFCFYNIVTPNGW